MYSFKLNRPQLSVLQLIGNFIIIVCVEPIFAKKWGQWRPQWRKNPIIIVIFAAGCKPKVPIGKYQIRTHSYSYIISLIKNAILNSETEIRKKSTSFRDFKISRQFLLFWQLYSRALPESRGRWKCKTFSEKIEQRNFLYQAKNFFSQKEFESRKVMLQFEIITFNCMT